MSLQGYWADLKRPDFLALPADLIAVLPIGAIEQHGPHLPLSVDRDLAEAVAEQALRQLQADQNVLILPTLSITKSGEHDLHPGTLSVSADTFIATLRDIGASVQRAGVARLVLLNGHGGNTAALEIVARDLRIKHDMIVAPSSWFAFAEDSTVIEPAALAYDLHAGETETSAMLALNPETVDMRQAKDFRPTMLDWAEQNRFIGLNGQAARPGWIIDDLHPAGACGNAAAATAEKGKLLLDSAARNFARFLAEFSRFDHRQTRPD